MQSNEWSKRYSSIYAKCEDFENCVVQHTTPFFSKNVSWRGGYRRFSSVFKSKNVVRILICFIATSLLLWGIVWYRSVRPQQKSALQCARDFKASLNIALPNKSPWGQDTISRGIGKRLVRQHHLLHNESLALCQQMLTCSLSKLTVCSLRGSRQTKQKRS